jgi:ssDNA-binding Zn-finger/Zn-ribbon topoisomerase 1
MEKEIVVCPKCKSGSVRVHGVRANPKTGKPLAKWILIPAYFVILVAVEMSILPFVLMSQTDAIFGTVIMLVFAALAWFFGIRMLKGYYGAPKIRQGECLNCRNTWTEWTGIVGQKAVGQFCPQCGKQEVFSNEYKANIDTQKPISAIFSWAGLLLGVFFGVGAVIMAIVTWTGGDDGFIQWQYGSTIAGLGFLAMSYFLGGGLIREGLKIFRAKLKRDYDCAACRNSWSQWADGTPIVIPQAKLDVPAEKKPDPEPK